MINCELCGKETDRAERAVGPTLCVLCHRREFDKCFLTMEMEILAERCPAAVPMVKKDLADRHPEYYRMKFPDEFRVEVPHNEAFAEMDRLPGVESKYEITLTTTKNDVKELLQWFQKIKESKMYGCVAMAYCIELQANGNPHLHCLLYSNKKTIDGSKLAKSLHFPYRYECKKVRKLGQYQEYMLKDSHDPAVLAYCEANGVDRFKIFI